MNKKVPVELDRTDRRILDALQTDGYPMRRVAAEARRVLLDMAASHFGVPVSALVVSDGMVSVRGGENTRDASEDMFACKDGFVFLSAAPMLAGASLMVVIGGVLLVGGVSLLLLLVGGAVFCAELAGSPAPAGAFAVSEPSQT